MPALKLLDGVHQGSVVNGAISGYTGASVTGITISSGGEVTIGAGAKANHIGVFSGGLLNVAGTVTSSVTVIAGGTETVSAGGLVSGASGSGTAVSGLVDVLAGGAFDYATVFAGGVLNLSAGATAFNIGVSNGGNFNIAGTLLSNGAVSSGGIETV